MSTEDGDDCVGEFGCGCDPPAGTPSEGTVDTTLCNGSGLENKCKISGRIELECCEDCGAGTPDQCFIISVFDGNGDEYSVDVSDEQNVGDCCPCNIDDPYTCWGLMSDPGEPLVDACDGGPCNGGFYGGWTLAVYDPAIFTPDCEDCTGIEAPSPLLRRETQTVAIDAKTGKPLTLIAEEMNSSHE